MKHLAIALFSLVLLSCEKAVDIQPEIQEAKLVVDASIENGRPPVVQLSRSLNFFSYISREMLQNSFVRNARVSISDGVTTTELKEYTLPVDSGYVVYYYSINNAPGTLPMLGQPGKSYTLSIIADGRQYAASTTVPLVAKTIDSLWWRPAPRAEDTPRVVLVGRFVDPPGFGNYVRYFTKVNSGAYLPGANSSFDDQIVDGTTYEIQVEQGINRNEPPEEVDYGFFRRGDTATIKLANIDKTTFDFWRTIEYSYQSVGNPFSSPTKVLGNISNGALGAFCGYGAQYKTIIIPK